MSLFRVTAVTADGAGYDHSWGDTYEVHAATQEEAESHVLGLEGVQDSRPYARIVKTWEKQVIAGAPHWELLRDEA